MWYYGHCNLISYNVPGGKEAEFSNQILYRIINESITSTMSEAVTQGSSSMGEISPMMVLINSREDIAALLKLGRCCWCNWCLMIIFLI